MCTTKPPSRHAVVSNILRISHPTASVSHSPADSSSASLAPDPSMAKPLLLLALLAATLAIASAAALGGRGRGPLVGGWSPIADVTDPHIQELGGWAVAQHRRLASDGLRFRRVTRGDQQVVSGMNYRLFVDAVDDAGSSAPYVAVVYEQLWTSTRNLTSFEPAANY